MTPGWPVTLRHGAVGLRPLRRRDAATWQRVRNANREWLSPWEGTLPPEGGDTPASYAAMIRTLRKRAKQGLTMPFVLTYDDEFIGLVTVNSITWGSARSASIGYWIAASHAGRGITPLAVAMVCDHLLGAVALHRVEIAIRPENAPSLRVVRKLGFTYVGRAPEFLHIDGQWRDHEIFQIVAGQAPGGLVQRVISL